MLKASILGMGVAFATLIASAHAAAAAPSEHTRAVAALTDIKAAIATIMDAENATSSGPENYTRAAHSAINALVGTRDSAYDPKAPDPGDTAGAIGQVNNLLDHRANPPFTNALHGVQVNELAAVASLQDAAKARGLDAYQTNVSDALENLEIAQGRSSQYDVLGGMMGAIANTSLGVPDGATILDGCAAPTSAGYGLSHGWLVWHALAPTTTSQAVAGSARMQQENGMLILYTAAAPMVQHHCATHAAIHPTAAKSAQHSTLLIEAAAHKAASNALYTTAQATSGKAVFTANCASCHGGNLQGVAAPAIAGNDFLKTAQTNKYTISILRTIVTQNMPFNNPASLKPKQYADVMAYLLASNCFPAGKTAFPEHPPATFGTAPLTTQKGGKPNKYGVCTVG